MSDSVRPHRRQPTRLHRPWDSPGKSTRVGSHFLFQCMKMKVKVKSLRRVRLFTTPWTAAHQAPPSMGFSRQEYWSGLPLPSPIGVHLLFLNAVPTFGLQTCTSLFSKPLSTHSPQKTKVSIVANVYVLSNRTCIFNIILGHLFLFLNYQQLVCIVFAIS